MGSEICTHAARNTWGRRHAISETNASTKQMTTSIKAALETKTTELGLVSRASRGTHCERCSLVFPAQTGYTGGREFSGVDRVKWPGDSGGSDVATNSSVTSDRPRQRFLPRTDKCRSQTIVETPSLHSFHLELLRIPGLSFSNEIRRSSRMRARLPSQ